VAEQPESTSAVSNLAGSAGSSKPAPIHPWERVAAVGMTGTGKSELLLSLWADDPGQRLLVDVQDAYYLGPDAINDELGCQEVHGEPREIDWSNRTIRYVPRRAGRAARQEFEDLYAAIWDRAQRFETMGHLTVLLDESYGPTEANWAPTYLTTALTQGRKKHLRHLAGMQRPAKIAPELLESADHVFVFLMGFRRDDFDRIGERFGWNGSEVGEELRKLADEYGYDDNGRFRCHAYLRHRAGQMEVHAYPPLPSSTLERTHRHVVNAT
jgi:hypothetical protein